MSQTLQVGSYTLHIGEELLDASFLVTRYPILQTKRLAIITDSHLVDTYGKALRQQFTTLGLSAELLSFSAGEAHKTRETKQQLEDTLLSKQFGRDSCLFALGGGVVNDMVGFLAATYCRGVPAFYLPTTLLAMIDASIGGKTGVNTPLGKNLIGSITQPHAVVMDIQTLKTLPLPEWRNGIAEMIKHSFIANADLFTGLQQSASPHACTDPATLITLIYQNCLIKKTIVEQDEFEQGLRQLLNFGHTIGHAVETLENYKIGHGEAVAMGMLVECHLAVQAGHLEAHVVTTLEETLRAYGLPLTTQVFQDKATFVQALILDKKSIQKAPRFVLLETIGCPHYANGQYAHPVLSEYLDAALEWANERFYKAGA